MLDKTINNEHLTFYLANSQNFKPQTLNKSLSLPHERTTRR